MSAQNRTAGTYVGTMPEDIYIRLDEIWLGNDGPLQVEQKKYTTRANLDYDIEVRGSPPGHVKGGAASALKTTSAKTSNTFALPLPSNLAPDTPEFLLSIAVGDIHLAHNMYARTITSKTFSQDSGGLISIEVTYDK